MGVMRDELLECLRYIILQDKNVIEKLRECEKRTGVDIYISPLRFRVLNAKSSINEFGHLSSSCDCWFEHEYFDYLRNEKCNQDMFNRTCSNVRNGHCEHLDIWDLWSPRTPMPQVFLIHAAVATNNKKVTKYISRQILKRCFKSVDNLTTNFGSLTAAHIAVVKGSEDALQYVIGMYGGVNKNDDSKYLFSFFFETSRKVVAKRNGVTGQVEMIELGNGNAMVSLLKLYISPFQFNILLQLMIVLEKDHLEELMHHFLSKKDEGMASILLNDRNVSEMCLDSSVLLTAIFTHAHDFIKIWIRQKQSLSLEVMAIEIHILPIEKALGCQMCMSLVSKGLKKDERERYYERTDISEYIVACNAAKRFEYETDTLLSILNTLFYRGSCNLNKRNRASETPLRVLVKSNFYMKEAMECLLDLGSDVNACDENGNTPLNTILKSSNCSVEAVNCFLEHGADINHTDSNGQTPFMEILRQIKQGYQDRLDPLFYLSFNPLKRNLKMSGECLKFCLYYNPRLDIHPNILTFVKDIHYFDFDGYVYLPLVPSDRSLSLFAMLLELGFTNFQIQESDLPVDILYLPRYKRYTLPKVDDYYRRFTSQPRSLRSFCRVRIRQAFPGYQLHILLKLIQIPKTLREYILFENELFHIKNKQVV